MTGTQPIPLATSSIVMTEAIILELAGLLKEPTPIPLPMPRTILGRTCVHASFFDMVGTRTYVVGFFCSAVGYQRASQYEFGRCSSSELKVPLGIPLVRMKAAPVKTDCESLGNEFMNGVFFSAHVVFEKGIYVKKNLNAFVTILLRFYLG